MKHAVATYNLSGKQMYYNDSFSSAVDAYKEYKEMIENLKEHLPHGYGCNVCRLEGKNLMSMETVFGK